MEIVGFTFEQFEECWYKDSKKEVKALFPKGKGSPRLQKMTERGKKKVI